uniref:HNH nuclease domain-containing protein n=1 Tax=Cannabis sativa TaxID=3483 RepID=A0A803Q3R2_CANSA
MAQFTAQGRVKLLFNGGDGGVSFGLEPNDPFHFKVRSIQPQKRKLKLSGHCFSCFVNCPFAYFMQVWIFVKPVNVVCWKRAICLEFMDKADVLEYYDQTVNSPSGSFYIPAVLRVPHLLQVVKRRRIKSNLSRKNILYRDNYTCQYCYSQENLTIDHVLPISRGGEWEWENLVTACSKCNSKKGHKTIEEANMKLIKVPKAPKEFDILAIPLTNAAIRMLKMRKGTPEEWRQYLP